MQSPLNSPRNSESSLEESLEITPTNTPIKKKTNGQDESSFYNNGTGLLSWGYKSVISLPVTASSAASSTKKNLGNVAGRAVNSLLNVAGRTTTSLVVATLNKGIQDCEAISGCMSQSLKRLDLSGKLPKIINQCVQHQITPEFMEKNNLGGGPEDLQGFLEFMAKQAIASLACYRPIMEEDVDKLPTIVVKNFILIINQWILKSGLQKKMQECRRLHVITQKSIKEAINSYQINYSVISKNKDSVNSLPILKTVFEKRKKELFKTQDKAIEDFEKTLEASIKDLVTLLLEIAKIQEKGFEFQAIVYKTVDFKYNIRLELEKYLTEFVRDFYLKALPRGESVENKKQSEIDLRTSNYNCFNAKNSRIEENSSDADYQSLDFSTDDFENSDCSLLADSEPEVAGSESEVAGFESELTGSESEIEDTSWLRRRKTPENELSLKDYYDENVRSTIFLEEVIEPELPLLQRGVLGIIEVVLVKYTNSLIEEAPKKKAKEAVKKILSKYGITEVELWISQVLMLGVSEEPLFVQLRAIFVECLAYRFIEVIEKLATLKPRAGLDFLESLILNSIEFTKENLHVKEDFTNDLKKYEHLVLQDEILEWRDHYFQSQWKIMPDNCDEKAMELRSVRVEQMFNNSNCNTNKIQELLVQFGIGLPSGDLGKIGPFLKGATKKPLMKFLQSSRKVVQEELQMYITKHFGLFAEKLLEVTGLDNDEAIGFGSFLNLPKIRTQTIPKLLLDAYCMAADFEKRPLQQIQDEILIRFIEKFSEQNRSENFAQESLLFLKVIQAFDQKGFMSGDEIKQFSDLLAHAGCTWFTVVNAFLERQKVSENFLEALQVLDPNNKLPDFCRSLRNKILVEAKKKMIKELLKSENPTYMPAYDAINKNGEMHKFVELYLDALLLRVFTKLACDWDEKGEKLPNGLFSNILKMVLHTIHECNDPSLMTDALLAAIGIKTPLDLQIIVLPFGNGKIEKLAFEEVKKQLPLLLNELYSGFLIPDQENLIEIKIQGHKALEADSAILAKNIIPMAFRWMGDEANRISLAAVIKDLLDEKEIEEVDRAWLEDLLIETSLLEYDKWSLILEMYERRDKYLLCRFGADWETKISTKKAEIIEEIIEEIFEVAPRYDKKKRRAVLKAIKELARENQAHQTNEAIQFFLTDERAEAMKNKLREPAGKDQIKNFWTFFEKILAPRLFRVFDHAARYNPQVTGNMLERVLVNSICVIQDVFQGQNSLQPDEFKDAIIEYDRLSLLVEAYDWRNRYLKEVKRIKAIQCEEAAKYLKLNEINEICEGNFDRKKYKALLCAIAEAPENSKIEHGLVEKLLLDFFQGSSLETRKMQKMCLHESFGPASQRVLELTGLTSDAAFFLPGASEGYYSLEFVRTQVVPQILLNFYRDMSDFSGLYENNMQEFDYFFGEQNEDATHFLSTFSQISAEKVKAYLTENREKIAKMMCELFPTAPLEQMNLIANAIAGLSSELGESQVNAIAIEVIYKMIEERIYGSLVHLVVSLIRQKGDLDLSEEEDIVREEHLGFNFFERTFSPKPNSKEHFSVKSKSKSHKPKINLKPIFEKCIFSKVWLSNILQSFGELFEEHRDDLVVAMEKYWELDLGLSDLPKGQQDEKRARKLQAIFLPITREFLLMSDLSSKNLNLPEFCQADIWETLTEEMLPNLVAKFYIEMTVLQNSQKEEAKRLKEILPHGPGVAVGFAHLIVEMLKSGLAIDGNGMGEDLHSVLTDFLIDTGFESGRLAAKGLGVEKEDDELIEIAKNEKIIENAHPFQNDPSNQDKIQKSRSKTSLKIERKNSARKYSEKLPESDLVKASINEIISDVVRSKKLTSFFSAVESYIAPPIQRVLSAMTLNLNPINNRPEVLKKIAENCILAAGDHFKRLHSVAVKEGKRSAYELVDSPSKLLDGVSLDRPILEYVFLEEKKINARQACIDSMEREKLWYVTEAMHAERKKETKKAIETLSNSRKALRRYVREKWSDRGVAVKRYLELERNLRAAELEEASQKESAGQWYANLIDFENGLSSKQEFAEKIQENRHKAQMNLEIAYEDLKGVTRNASSGQNDVKADPLKNLCSMVGYREARKKLEAAQKDLEAAKINKINVEEAQKLFDEVSQDFETYRIDAYFKPLSEKLLKLVGDKPFENLDFPEELPMAIRAKIIETIKNKLPEVLNTIFHTLVKPETQQGILLKFIKDANKATAEANEVNVCEKVMDAGIKPEREKSVGDDDFETRCGSMALDLIEMLPKGSLEIFHRLQTVKDAIKGDGGKYIGDNLSSSLEKTSMIHLLDSLLKLALTSSMPQGTWQGTLDENNLEYTPFIADLPKNPDEVKAAKEKRVIEAQKTKKDLQNEITVFMENEIASPINAYLKEAGKGFMGGLKGLIENIFSEETAETLINKFENLAHNVYALFAAIVNFIASVTVWPVARWFIGTMPQDITETFSLEAHEQLVFEWVNIVMDTIDEELEKLPANQVVNLDI